MTSSGAARLGGDAKIAWIDELDVLGGFLQPFCVNIFGNGAAIFENGIVRLDVSFFFRGIVSGGIWRGAGCDRRGGVAAMAIRAAEMNGLGGMHGGLVGGSVAGNTAGGFAISLFLRLAAERG